MVNEENTQNILEILAEQARNRAERRRATLPTLGNMASMMAATELRLQAEANEVVLAKLGVNRTSVLRAVAEKLPGVTERLVRDVLRVEDALSAALSTAAERTKRA